MPQVSHSMRVVNTSVLDKPTDHSRIVDNSVIEGEFTFNECTDVHVGPKYEHNGNIIINQNISVSSEKGSASEKDLIAISKEDNELCVDTRYHCAINYCCKHIITIATFSLTVVLTGLVLLMFTNYKGGSSQSKKKVGVGDFPMSSGDYPIALRFVQRESWGAAQPTDDLMNNTLPVRRVIFIHTVSSGTCNKFTACKQQVLNIQDFHINIGYGDIGYNFVIGSDGYIYVGVGWDKVGAHSKGFNIGSLGIAFIGDFRRDEPNELMLDSAKRLLEFGMKIKKLSDDYQLFGHCQILTSFPESPGKHILKIIKTWDHWNSTNVNQCVGFKK